MDRGLIQEAVADEVRAELARQRLSGVRAARALGWTQNYIARRMIGAVAFDAADLVELSQLLDVPVAKFFESAGIGVGIRRPGYCRALAAAA